MCDLTDPIFADAEKAREHLEKLHWPNGPVCRHCGNADPARITKMAGKSLRPGVYQCNECRKPFSVTVGTAMERSKNPPQQMAARHAPDDVQQKGQVSAHQLDAQSWHRLLSRPRGSWRIAFAKECAIWITRRRADSAARTRSSRSTKPMSAAKPKTARTKSRRRRKPFCRLSSVTAASLPSMSPTSPLKWCAR